MKKVVFCEVAWMKYYAGVSEADRPKNGGKYIVFIPVSDEEEIEDEFGNKILNKLSAEEKIKNGIPPLNDYDGPIYLRASEAEVKLNQ